MIYADVDDTLVRSFGGKRIAIPHVLQLVRELSGQAELFLWSRGGADYARATAEELGVADCFTAFLPKPELLIDDAELKTWRVRELHPSGCHGKTAEEVLSTFR